MATLIQLRCFTSSENRSLYEQYLALKYQVFVVEQRWRELADPSGKPIARKEPFDAAGHLYLASTPEDDPVGTVRGIALTRGFPHRELLEHHLRSAEVQGMWAYLCTLNALAVVPSHRRNDCEAVGLGWKGSLGKLLMLAVMHQMELQGMKAALATTGGIVSTRLCRSLGFFVIDAPTRSTHLHPEIVMTNVGIVFGSPAHLRAQQDCGMRPKRVRPLSEDAARLLRYFEERQKEVLHARDLDELIQEATATQRVSLSCP
jgi:hypothetical protein